MPRASVERRLAELLPQDLVLAAHHGSQSSSARVLVKRTAPRFVIFSAALPSPFGHPHDVVARWRAEGAHPVLTGAQGMVLDSRWPGRVVRRPGGALVAVVPFRGLRASLAL